MALTNKLSAIANAIRAKTGKSGSMTLDQMVTEIDSISVGSSVQESLHEEAKTVTLNGSDRYTITFSGTPSFVSLSTGITRSTGGYTFRCIGNISFEDSDFIHTSFFGENNLFYQILAMRVGNTVTMIVMNQGGTSYISGKSLNVKGYWWS